MLLNLRCGLVPACLSLGALLCVLPVFADTPTAPPPSVLAPQTIALQNVVPSDVIKMMHWDLSSKLPAGVTQIQSLPAQNALTVTATPAGFARVRDIVKILDIQPRQVQIKYAVASASTADAEASGVSFDLVSAEASAGSKTFYLCATGKPAAQFLQTLTKQGTVTEEPDIVTTNNVAASLSMSSGSTVLSSFAVTPRINSDNSITLALHAVFLNGAVKREITTLHTFRNGDTTVFSMPDAYTQAKGSKMVLLFVTPTLK